MSVCVLSRGLLYLSEGRLQWGVSPRVPEQTQPLIPVSFLLFVYTHREGRVQPGRSP